MPKTLQICEEITIANYLIVMKLLLTKVILLFLILTNAMDTHETIKPYFCTFQFAQFLSRKLKLNCAPGFDGLSAYHIIFAHEILLLHISMFFNLCFVHCYVPNLYSYSVLTPIIKR